MRGERDRIQSIVEISRGADVVRGNPEQWPHIKKKIALGKILTFRNATEQRI